MNVEGLHFKTKSLRVTVTEYPKVIGSNPQ